jgi:hypothetical protein
VVPLHEEFAQVKDKISVRNVNLETLLAEMEASLEKMVEAKSVRIKQNKMTTTQKRHRRK